ncbi:hypothetical protein ACXR2U_11385 [Jatrophihabitans sp. YIM 134969]
MYIPIVRHWRRGDLDRLYITTATGRQLGWFDLVDETLHTATESLRPMLWRAVTDFRLARRPEIPAAKDLAAHEAGVWELERAFKCVDESPLFFFASSVCKERDERAEWETAAEGAMTLGEAIAAMSNGWVALHSVPSGRHAERLDHVLVGPAGVVVVLSEHLTDGEVSAAGDTVVFDGVPQKIVAHLGKLADHVASRVPDDTPVHVVVAVHGATVTRRRPLVDDRVRVVAAEDVPAVAATLPTPVDGPTQDALFALLRRRATWYPHGKHGSSRNADPSFALAGLQFLDGLPRLTTPPAAPGKRVAVRTPAVAKHAAAAEPAAVVEELVPLEAVVDPLPTVTPPALGVHRSGLVAPRRRNVRVVVTRPTAA